MDVPPPVVTVQLSVGERIGQHYILISQIGAGAFGAIFSVKYEHRDVKKKLAVKFEEGLRPFTFLHNEMVVLKSLAGIRHFAKYYQQGVHKNYRYIVMELLGPSMIEVVNRQKPYKFTLSQALKFGIQGIESLASIHDQGFVHRDIKPGNFVIGNTVETSGIFYLIDFGLCKRLQVKDGVVIKPPQNGNFRGTMRYASIQAHNKEELVIKATIRGNGRKT
ncbi:MAG: putative Tau-tubulin kinase 2 [Streblomastix strix]|uniref:non-specific serine/threonine protein kinase n=1 Tax=Streblomastix strix TaxID=222440 RepID=A0A5J4VK78_9EUKA|nr:MAG: putative Tau-tubulin kinase 2 [Streblomastix strix]